MVNEFNKIVGEMLASEGAVHLPDVGTLVVVRRPAERISSRRLRRSCNAVLFTDKVRGRSVVDVVAEICGTDEAEAQDIYRRWLSKVTADGVVAIDGVGHIDRMRFYVDDAFDKLLNPNGHQVVELEKHRGRKALWICFWTILGLAAAGCVGYCMYECREDIADTLTAWFAPKEKPAQTEEIAVLREPAESENTETEDMAAPAAEETSELVQPEPQPEPTPEPEAAPQEDTQPQKAVPVTPSDGIGRLTSGWNYVVYGVFSTPENAMRAIADLRANGVTGCAAFAYGSRYMVTVYSSAEVADCNRFIRTALGFENLWVYTAH